MRTRGFLVTGLCSALTACGAPTEASRVSFVDVTTESGLEMDHAIRRGAPPDAIMTGGVSAGDFDGDGWLDLYAVGGDQGRNALFRNRGDGSFEEVAGEAGVAVAGALSAGAVFADVDGDGDEDLFVGGIDFDLPQLFSNQGDGTYQNVTEDAGLMFNAVRVPNSWGAAFGDYDEDGDLDLFVAHWAMGRQGKTGYLWRNDGGGSFEDVSEASGMAEIFVDPTDSSYTPNFADINNDGAPDLLVASDWGNSRVLLNRRDGTFEDVTTDAIDDSNGMGASVGDFDNDGNLDWFVSSILSPSPGEEHTGNRLYRGNGDGTFENVTEGSGILDGAWAWGTCFADFDNDGRLDLFQVNGFAKPDTIQLDVWGDADSFVDQPARLFMSSGDGTFVECADEAEIDDRGRGIGVSCLDYDRDGDIDVAISNNEGPLKLYRNDSPKRHFLSVRLEAPSPNTRGIGARISVTSPSGTQLREIRAGNNFLSQDPAEAHFGLGDSTEVELAVTWPDGLQQYLAVDEVDRVLVVHRPSGDLR